MIYFLIIYAAPALQKSSATEQMNGKVTDDIVDTDYIQQGIHVCTIIIIVAW